MALPLSLLLVPLQQPAGTTALIAMAGVRAQSAAFWEAVQGRESECPKVSQNPDWIFPTWKSIPFPVTSEKGEKVSGWLSQHKLRPSSSCKCPCSSDGLCAKAASVRWNFFFFLKSFSKDVSGSHLTEGRLATLWQKLVYGRYLWPRSTLIVMAA